MEEISKYGNCDICGDYLVPVYFIEEERTHDKYNTLTGRKRKAVDYLVCEACDKKYCVDDTFDGPWYKE